MLDKFGIYLEFIWDISRINPGFVYIPDKSRIYPKYIPEYIPNLSGIYSQIPRLGGTNVCDLSN
jgi:hypothetical protein